jgi:6-phosphogluconolactonase
MRRVMILPDAAALAAAAAEEFIRAASGSTGIFRVALSGGTTPKTLYELLADEKGPYRSRVPWQRLHFYWSDERCVPPNHPDSNYRMACDAMLSRVPVPPEHVHRVEGELGDAAEAASRYEETILATFDALPRFDWIFLGMGEDGHTASLFPRTMAVVEKRKLVTDVWIEVRNSHRVTLTFPVINVAKTAAFLVAGADKAVMAQKVLEEAPSTERPASLVAPRGELLWLLDRSAAGLLKP